MKKRGPWQFSLQSALLLVALAATLIAWWLDHRSLSRKLDEAQQRIQFLKTAPFFDDLNREVPR